MLATGSQMQPSVVQCPSPQGDWSEVDFIKQPLLFFHHWALTLCLKRLTCTTLHRCPSDISKVTRLLIDLTIHFPSHWRSSFPAVGIDNQTDSPISKLQSCERLLNSALCLVAASERLAC